MPPSPQAAPVEEGAKALPCARRCLLPCCRPVTPPCGGCTRRMHAWRGLPRQRLPAVMPAVALPPIPTPAAPRAVQGIPLRIELGPRDMENGVAMLARRDTGAKEVMPWGELVAKVPALLEQIQVGRVRHAAVWVRAGERGRRKGGRARLCCMRTAHERAPARHRRARHRLPTACPACQSAHAPPPARHPTPPHAGRHVRSRARRL